MTIAGVPNDLGITVLNGFEVLPAEGRVVTNESVRQLVEETEDA